MSSTPKFNSKSPTIRRILREAAEISSSPSPDYTATPLETDLFEWHFTIKGPPSSPFAEGIYHGRISLPPNYPLRPPMFRFVTPSGRFEANREICLSISGHHEETWQPAWGVRTALVALRSFMETNPQGQLGGLETSDAVRRRLAAESRSFVCPTCGRSNEEIMKETEEAAAAAEAKAGGSQGSSKKEIEIPKELRMGWKDEMKTESSLGTSTPQRMPAETTTTSSGDSDVDTAAALAEGFVQTGPPASVGGTQGSIVPAATQQGHPPPQPPQFPPVPSPQPTRTAPLPNPGPPAAHQHQGGGVVARNVQAERPVVNQAVPGQLAVAQQRRRNTVTDESLNDGVPIWVDRAIVAVGAVVLALLVRILFG